jgi:tetratricopeptide (TPR) repeat protein
VLKAQERFAEAEGLYRETAAQFPNNVFVRTGLAEVLKAQGRFAEAEILYRETAAQFPNDAVARNGLAEVLKAQGRFAEAETLYREVVVQFPNDRVSRHGLANLLRGRGSLGEALHLVPEPSELRGLEDYYDLHLRGMIFLEQGNVGLAIAAFKRGHEGNPPRRTRLYFQGAMAIARLSQGRFEEAQRELAAAPDDKPEVNALRLHAMAGLGQTAEAKRMYSEVSARILTFPKPTARAVEKISVSWGLRPGLEPRQPTPPEVDEVIAAEIEMLMAA